jgi:ClpP class serine protease
MAWFLKPEIAAALRAGRMSGYHPTLEERAHFEVAMREAYAKKDAERPRNMKVAGDVAELSVDGVLTEKPDCIAMLFGGGNTTYQSIREGLALADSDPSVKSIVLNISSPGGSVTGLFETLAAIEGTQKPIKVRSSLAASAAYGIAAMAGPIEATTPASEFGSIGVAAHIFVDDDAIDIASTEAPKKRPDVTTEEGVAAVREELDAMHELFVDAIARGRAASTGAKVTAADVNANFGRGGVLVAKQAKAAGMIDRISAQPKRAPTGKRAEAENETPDAAPPKDASASAGAPEDSLMDLNQLKAQHPELFAAAFAEGEAKERKRVNAHLTLGKKCGAMDFAVKCIAEGKSSLDEDVHAEYIGAAANRRDQASRQADSDTAGRAADGAQPPPAAGATDAGASNPKLVGNPAEPGDLGDQVAARLEAQRGKKPSA